MTRPASVHEAIERARDTLHRIEEHDQPVLPDEVFQEASRITCWMDCEGMARRIHTLLSMLEEHVAELDDVPDEIFTLLLAANEQAAQLADAIFAVEALEWAIKKHEIEQARAEAAAKAKSATKSRKKAREAAI